MEKNAIVIVREHMEIFPDLSICLLARTISSFTHSYTSHDREQQSSTEIPITMVDAGTKKALSSIPLLQTRAGPREKELWVQRLKEEYQSLIKVSLPIHLWICPLFSLASLPFLTVRAEQQDGGHGLVPSGVE